MVRKRVRVGFGTVIEQISRLMSSPEISESSAYLIVGTLSSDAGSSKYWFSRKLKVERLRWNK